MLSTRWSASVSDSPVPPEGHVRAEDDDVAEHDREDLHREGVLDRGELEPRGPAEDVLPEQNTDAHGSREDTFQMTPESPGWDPPIIPLRVVGSSYVFKERF